MRNLFQEMALRRAGESPVPSSLLGCSQHRWASYILNIPNYANTQEANRPEAAEGAEP